MIAVIQRVTSASVSVDEKAYFASIGPGLCVLLGVERGDTDVEANWLARKLPRLRIFRDEDQRMNRSLVDVGGALLLVSQFTLVGDCSKGHRPSFIRAAAPENGERLYRRVAERMRSDDGVIVETGQFGAMMSVQLTNDGPVTLIVQR